MSAPSDAAAENGTAAIAAAGGGAAPTSFALPQEAHLYRFGSTIITSLCSVLNEVKRDHLDANENGTLNAQRLESLDPKLLSAVQSGLAKRHPSLFIVQVANKRKHDDGKPPAMRVWRPSRPALAKAAAQMIHDGVGMDEAPVGKREHCELPFKVFPKRVASELGKTPTCAEYSKTFMETAVGEVVSAIYNEAMTLQMGRQDSEHDVVDTIEYKDAQLVLHGWRRTILAMNEAGKELMASAAARVVERLSEPQMQVRKVRS